MKDPGPNVLEQQIETNRLLAAILAASGAPAAAVAQTLAGGAVPIQWPILFYFSNPSNNPFRLTQSGAGATAALTFLDRESIDSQGALKITTDVGTGQWAQVAINLPMTPALAIRLQIAFTMAHDSPGIDWYFDLNRFDMDSQHEAQIKFVPAAHEGFYLNSLNLPISLGQHIYATTESTWNKLDLVVDFATDMYHWVGVNNNAVDLSAQAIKTSGALAAPRFEFYVKVVNSSADTPAIGVIDQILITDALYAGPAE